MNKSTWWTLGGLGVAGLGIGVYFLWYKKKRPKPWTPHLTNPKNENTGIGGGISIPKSGGKPITEPNWNDPFDMNYSEDVKKWQAPRKVNELDPLAAKQYAKELKEAYGGAWYLNDDEKAVESVFAKKLQDKVEVSNVSKAFWNLYQKDLWEYLAHFLSKRELEKYLQKPVRELPGYRMMPLYKREKWKK